MKARNVILATTILILIVILSACSSKTLSPTQIIKEQPTAVFVTATIAPTQIIDSPTPTMSPTPRKGSMEEMSFNPPAEGRACLRPEKDYQNPRVDAFRAHDLEFIQDTLVICIFGVGAGDIVNIELYTDNQHLITKGLFSVLTDPARNKLLVYQQGISGYDLPLGSSDLELVGEGDARKNFIGIDVAWPIDFPDQGVIRVLTDKFDIRTTYANPHAQISPHISILDSFNLDRSTKNPFVNWGCLFFKPDDRIRLVGNGFDPNSEIMVAIYYMGGVYSEYRSLYLSLPLSVSGDGKVDWRYDIKPTDPQGIYFVVAVLNPDVKSALDKPGPISCFRVH